MPPITVKMYPGRSDEVKQKAAQEIMQAAMQALDAPATAFTVIMEDIPREEWNEKVFVPEIEPNEDLVLIRQGKSTKEE